MAKKSAARDQTRGRPLTLAALERYGAFGGWVPPEGDFDADGIWKHPYRLWLVAGGGVIAKPAGMHYRGLLEIRRERLPERAGIALRIYQSILQHSPGVHETKVEMTTDDDALAGPRRWKLTNTVLDPHLKPIPEAGVQQTGEVEKDTVTIAHGQRTTTFEVPVPLTTNWSLFDAIQRMPRRQGPPLEFAMLQQCDLLKTSQQISYRGVGEHTLGGHSVRLHHWQHVGRGILPYSYYTDEPGRLLVAVGGLRAYIFDPGAPQLHKRCLNSLTQRAKR